MNEHSIYIVLKSTMSSSAH